MMPVFLSFNEVDSATKKAFRGAGYHWGDAEEAGKAAVWLARRGIFAIPPMLALLDHADRLGPDGLRPVITGRHWQGRGGVLCPICAGAALADLSQQPDSGSRLLLRGLLSPILLLPFAASASASMGRPLAISWERCELVCDGPGVLTGKRDGFTAASGDVALQVVTRGGPPQEPALPETKTVDVDDDLWSALQRLAHRTYVPASDQSRISGAGAGLSDND